MSIIQRITAFWTGVGDSDLQAAFGEMIAGAGDLIGDLLPLGITLMFVMAGPRIVRRVISTFI